MESKETIREFDKEVRTYIFSGTFNTENLSKISKEGNAIISLSTSKYNEETETIDRYNTVEVNERGLNENYSKRIQSVVDSYHSILEGIRKKEKRVQAMLSSDSESEVYVKFSSLKDGQRKVAAILTLI